MIQLIVNRYNNTYYRTIKMKPVDVKPSICIDFNKAINDKDPKFKVGDIIRISKYKNVFAKGYVPNQSQEVFVKNTVLWTYVISDLKGKEIVGTFYEKELQKTYQKEFRVETVIKTNNNKLYVKWNGYENCSDNWIDKKRHNRIKIFGRFCFCFFFCFSIKQI